MTRQSTRRVHQLPADDEVLPALNLWPLVRTAVAMSAFERCEELAAVCEEHGITLQLVEHTRVFTEIDDALAQTGLFKSLNQPGWHSKSSVEDILSASDISKIDKWYAAVTVEDGTIYITWALVERLWAYCFAYQNLFDIALGVPFGQAFSPVDAANCLRAMKILEWTRECERLKQHLKWPTCLPKPDRTSSTRGQQMAHQLFVRTIAWILLHEIGHVVCKHPPDEKSPRRRRSQELQADDWASIWLVGSRRKFRGKEDEFRSRATGIVLALSLISSIEIYNEQRVSDLYPDGADRLRHFLRRFVPKPTSKTPLHFRFPWIVACLVLETQLAFAGSTNLSRSKDMVSYFGSLSAALDRAADYVKKTRPTASPSTSRRSLSARRSTKGRKS